nr:acylphosphatase [Lentilactobacillus otakiensis]
MNDNIKTVKMNASGRVQGVGFRWATIQIAESLDISGWVKNEPDGSVSILASGSHENLDHFIEKNPPVTNFICQSKKSSNQLYREKG